MKPIRTFRLLAIGIAAALVSTGCQDGLGVAPAEPTLDPVSLRIPLTVIVSPSSGTLKVDGTLQLYAEVRDQFGQPMDESVRWSTSSPFVASISPSGLLTGHAPGSVTARAKTEGLQGAWGSGSYTVEFGSPEPEMPGTVTDLSVTGTTHSSATLQFTEVGDGAGGAADYEIRYRNSGSGDWSSSTVAQSGSCAYPVDGTNVGNRLTCNVDGLNSDTSYDFQVVAHRDGFGAPVKGLPSNTATGITKPLPNSPPDSPILSASAITATGVTLTGGTFSDPDGGNTHSASEWQVDELGGDWSSLAANSGVTTTHLTSFAATGLTASTEYQARARYRDNNAGWSAWSHTRNFTTTAGAPNSAPSAPTLSTSSITTTGATLTGGTFSDPDAGNTHSASEWQVDEQGGDWSILAANSGVSTTNLTSFVATGLAASTDYQARARYRDNNAAWSAWSVTKSFTTASGPNAAPDAPVLTVSNITTTGATLNSSPFSDPDEGNTHSASDWQVDEQGGDWSSPVVNTGGTTTYLTSFAATGLAASTSYQARARHRDNNNAWGAWSAIQSFTTTGTPNSVPNAPTILVSNISTSGATLNGSAFSDPDAGDTHSASEWQVDEQGGNWSSLVANSGVVTTNLTSFAVTGLAASTNYQARVHYRDGNNAWSAWSATQSFTTASTPNSPPNAPTLSVSGITASSATLNGSAFSDPDAGNTHSASEWQVDELGGNWSTPVANSGVTTTNLTSFAAAGLAASTNYQARVHYRDNNNAWSAWSGPQTFTTSSSGGGGGANFLFASDWSTALGNSDAAVTDGGRWDFISADFTGRILSSAGLDFPTANVFDVYTTATRTGWVELRRSTVPVPAIGESRYYRWYFRFTAPDGLADNESHPVQDGGAASQANWRFHTYNSPGDYFGAIPAGQWRPRFDFNGGPYPFNRVHGPNLNKNQTYRFEVHVRRETASTFRMSIRIYNSAGALVADDSTIRSDDHSLTLSQAPAFNIHNLSGMSVFNAGHNGFAPGTYPFPFTYAYEAAFAICTNTWCGAYTPGEGR